MHPIMVIAASAGGLPPLRHIAAALPAGCAASVFVVFHIGSSNSHLPEILNFSGIVPALCALTATLILDEDGIYDPSSFNDRLLLGLKGTMSEAELHILRARMRGGQINKARRGELEIGPPVGLVYRSEGMLDLDPDTEVQAALRFRYFRPFGKCYKDSSLFPG
jgi:hypothetical protein